MTESTIRPLVLEYFGTHPDAEVTPGEMTRWVADRRGKPDQSAGAVRSALHKLHTEGLVERVPPSTPLRYRWVGDQNAARLAMEKIHEMRAPSKSLHHHAWYPPAWKGDAWRWGWNMGLPAREGKGSPDLSKGWYECRPGEDPIWHPPTGEPSKEDTPATHVFKHAVGDKGDFHVLEYDGLGWVTNKYWMVRRGMVEEALAQLGVPGNPHTGDYNIGVLVHGSPGEAQYRLGPTSIKSMRKFTDPAEFTATLEKVPVNGNARKSRDGQDIVLFARPDGTRLGIRSSWVRWIEDAWPENFGEWKLAKSTKTGMLAAYVSLSGNVLACVMGAPISEEMAAAPKTREQLVADLVREYFETYPDILSSTAQVDKWVQARNHHISTGLGQAIGDGVREGWLVEVSGTHSPVMHQHRKYDCQGCKAVLTNRKAIEDHKYRHGLVTARENKPPEPPKPDPGRELSAHDQHRFREILKVARRLYLETEPQPEDGWEVPLFSFLFDVFTAYAALHGTDFGEQNGSPEQVVRAMAEALAKGGLARDAGTALIALQELWEIDGGDVE